MIFVLGSHGRLGRAIAGSALSNQTNNLHRSIYAEWWRDGSADAIARFFEKSANTKSIIYNAAGIIDPKLNYEDHELINFKLAKNIVVGATKLGLKVVTFGTVMEKVVGDKTTNPYYLSKTKLGHFVEEFCSNSNLALHIRIHTLFGGDRPSSFMFLGQILHAIESQTEFKMTPGMQLREYHHIDDEVAAIYRLVDSGLSGAIELSHGQPVTLRELATYIFESYRCANLLKIGALPEPVNDNYGLLFERTVELTDMVFRDTLPNVIQYLRSYLS
ncbi:NAD-dependent epimerase/dehydratase family protein [Methylomonas montana]|uniref:NAD-dependent epimerase/dehydratase family protein n=1 Tax=Methylomonas montana TaxID=3058963 RepID=UPI00265B542D|nr:NAD-dependent epimerase/dehydratase family protein [Methylomonas montana]WKJ92017.1 NAD-dependent epimerase/dehydratase family protein [Methylomonas montana]